MDAVVLSHESAVDCLRAVARSGRMLVRPSQADDVRFVHDPQQLADARSRSWIVAAAREPLHIMLSTGAKSYATKCMRAHAVSGSVPAEWLCRAHGNVFFAGPELATMQLAAALEPEASRLKRSVSFASGESHSAPKRGSAGSSAVNDALDLLVLLYELCGAYASASDGKLLRRKEPLTTKGEFVRACSWFAGRPGVARLRRLLPFLVDGARSPMEARLTLLLCLPVRLGGYGLPWPRLNVSLPVPSAAGACGDEPITPDLYWAAARFAIEYDSWAHHSSSTAFGADSIRRNALSLAGVTAMSVTTPQVLDTKHMDAVARVVARQVGVRLRHQFDGWAVARRTVLRARLFAGMHLS